MGWNGSPICSIQYFVSIRRSTPSESAALITASGVFFSAVFGVPLARLDFASVFATGVPEQALRYFEPEGELYRVKDAVRKLVAFDFGRQRCLGEVGRPLQAALTPHSARVVWLTESDDRSDVIGGSRHLTGT